MSREELGKIAYDAWKYFQIYDIAVGPVEYYSLTYEQRATWEAVGRAVHGRAVEHAWEAFKRTMFDGGL